MFWKIQFNDKREGIGYLQFDENMIAVNLFDEHGNVVTEPCGYSPIEFDVAPPEWAQ